MKNLIRDMVFVTLFFLSSVAGSAPSELSTDECLQNSDFNNPEPSPNLDLQYFCLSSNRLSRIDIYVTGTTGRFLQRKYFFGAKNILEKRQFLNPDGQLDKEDFYEYVGNDIYRLNPSKPIDVVKNIRRYDQVKFTIRNLVEETVQMDYWKQSGEEWRLYIQDFLGTTENGISGHIRKRLIYDSSGKFEIGYQFFFDPKLPYVQIMGIDVLNEQEQIVASFSQKKTGDAKEMGLLYAQLAEQHSEKKKPIVLIDSGFDSYNPDLVKRMGLVESEVVDNLDNDSDGFVDNFAGFIFDNLRELNTGHVTAIPSFAGGINTPYPLCHGTHVGDLFTRDLKKSGIIPFGGDFTKPSYLSKIAKWIANKKVKFVNMSFDFGSYNSSDNSLGIGLPVDSIFELEQMVLRNAKTLFVIAAGNGGGVNLDASENFPATIKSQNKIVVAALNTSQIVDRDLRQYKLAEFSNLGEKSVDVAAPGYKVLAWNFGNHRIPLSGTSMASPIVANVAVKIDEIYDNIDIQDIKEIIMKTVYISRLDKPLPVRSGGIMIEERALLAAKLLSLSPSKSIEKVCLQARRMMPLPNELVGVDEKQLIEFWRKRGL